MIGQTTRYECPIGACPWTLDNPGPDPSEGSGKTIGEIAFSAVRAHLVRSEAAVRGHLETHSLLEWVQEVMRLREKAAGSVTVGREDLERVFGYARHFDVDDDDAMRRVKAMLGA